ncbi:LysR family transcriptional regulator [Bradyrhizobium sp. SSUT77]|uniref:LysR family transcriptional regulator n=1 Tax=Bradyrhizobium sp. SSUT77 TaxID=3040603 RepID=UPI00244CF87E|nr:LysR family transcriptional regulator [Bradyrhizobium sp. SSUT77]MDH2344201.1 LysR family transcriptional regulator [Bradyrhizobium sp. SSUT77]
MARRHGFQGLSADLLRGRCGQLRIKTIRTSELEKAEIDLRRLRYFLAVCEHGGFSRASNSIGIAQPSVTRQIKLLEKEIGLPLINRKARGAEPTDEGRLLLEKSRQHIAELDNLVHEIRSRSLR